MKKEKTMHELAKEFPDKTYRELELYREKDRQQEAGVCVMGEMRKDREFEKEIDYHRYWKDMYEKEHQLRKEAQDALANSLETNESHQKLNGKLQERLTELEEENKKMHDAFDKQIDGARKAGM